MRKMVLRRWRRWWGVGAVGAGSVPDGARFAARIYCAEQYFYWAARFAFGNKRGN